MLQHTCSFRSGAPRPVTRPFALQGWSSLRQPAPRPVRWSCSTAHKRPRLLPPAAQAEAPAEEWNEETEEETCNCDEVGQEVEYVRWSTPQALSSLDIDWEDAEYLQEQRNYQTSSGDAISPRNQVQLSTYGNHIGDNMHDLFHFMQTRLEGAIGGIHLLPVYPSSGDGGFAPLTYKEINPEMGSWDDIADFAGHYDVTMELMVNHISPASAEFQDYLAHGEKSKTADMWIDWSSFWPGGDPTKKQLEAIRTRKPEPPVLKVEMKDGSTKRVWCTFGAQQIDLDPFSASGKQFLRESLGALGKRGAKMVRLDAFGYATKKPGTRCFMEEPECWQLLEDLRQIGKDSGIGLLCEVHEEYSTNIELAKRGFWVYDFALPLLLLHATTFKTAVNMRNWLRICPRRQITVLDTHDGMGIDDIEGLAQVVEVESLKTVVTEKLGCGPNFKYHYRMDKDIYEGAPHQYNCTFFSAMEGDARRYLMCRAVQFFTPGIPMIYYVGLFAGKNDWLNVKPEDGSTRGINRHRYTLEEADEALEQPVVAALLRLCKFRNTHPAFNGQISIPDAEDHILEIIWENGPHRAHLFADFKAGDFHTEVTQAEAGHRMHQVRYSLSSIDEGDSRQNGHHAGPRQLEKKQSFANV